MKSLLPITFLVAFTSSGAALAGDDCNRPMAQWQSRDAVTARATQLGIVTERLRIDDGCYEIRGRDQAGHRVDLKMDPATLTPLKLEVHFRPGADTSRYLPATRSQTGKATQPAARKPLQPSAKE